VKKEKMMLLDDMQGQMKKSGTFIVTQYQGLSGARAHEFRRELGKSGAYFEVVRKRMLLHAAKNLGISFDPKQLPGHIGLVLGASDPLETTKFVLKFSENNEQAIQLLGGFFEGQKLSADDVKRLAKLPSRDVMRSEFLGLLEAPMAQMLSTIEAVLSSVVYCMDNKINESKGG
jgi:large subunit ribosomal protein L10